MMSFVRHVFPLFLAVALLALAGTASAADAAKSKEDVPAEPQKIVLIAGPKDEYHGEGTHEYPKTIATLKKALQESNVADAVEVVTVYDGWPEDPKVLDDADTIFLASAGADRAENDHPFLRQDRMEILQKQMDRGCGLVMFHWSVFVPVKHEEQFIDWMGGFFDYERGDGENGWYSDIAFATAKIEPNAKHDISKGVHAFDHHDEYYYNIRFAEKDARVTPIVTVTLPDVKEPQVVGWTVKRNNGGRSFSFTGGHFQKSWENDNFRTMMLNAICWTAKVPIPPGGVHEQLSFDDQWTPKPHLGKEDLPKEKEADWVDGRIRLSDVGPYYTTSMIVPEPGDAPGDPKDTRKGPVDPNMVLKSLAIDLSGEDDKQKVGILFDKQAMVMRCGWTDGFLNFSDVRFGLLEKPTIEGEIAWRVPADAGWTTSSPGDAAFSEDKTQPAGKVRYKGLYLDEHRVVLSYSVAGCGILESPSLAKAGDFPIFLRTFEVGPTDRRLELPILHWPGSEWKFLGSHFEKGEEAIIVDRIDPAEGESSISSGISFPIDGNHCRLQIYPYQKTQQFGVAIWRGSKKDVEEAQKQIDELPPVKVLSEVIKEPTSRWGEPLVTEGKLGQPESDAPFAVDTITIPYENRYGALFFLGGFDFAPDGTCYVAAAHGDVWKVTGIDDDLDKITWQRFATGLYEPLGLVVRDGEVFVLGRDQITRLHDTNGDGEADFYECFNDELTDQGQSHAYAMCLETDAEGNFFFLKSGAPQTPHGGSLIKVSADGESLTRYASGFRHPNGMSIGPKGTLTAADNEGNWVPVTRIDIVEKGEFCGHVPTAHLDPVPKDPGQPLCWLPRVVDNSAGGQAWVPEGQWGPLAGELLHLSYGQCTASLILKEKVNGVWQGGAVRMPTPDFLSGVCRGRFRTSGKGADGHLYVTGLNGWSSTAAEDSCFQRVRYLDRPLRMLTGAHIHENGIELVFPEPIDAELASDPERYAVAIWGYRWTKDYGSKDYSIANPEKEGRDQLKVTGAEVSSDGRRVFVTAEGLQPAMQLRVQAGLGTAAGEKLPVDYYGTIHELRPAKSTGTERRRQGSEMSEE